MLSPTEREQLLEALRPPSGYDLDAAIGTTFSLDLLTLLTLPIGFASFDWQDDSGRPTAEPMALLEAVRRFAERMTIFCQAGRIPVPKNVERLYAYLENSVYEVTAADERGVFHPKVWVLRFVGPDEAIAYRVLCLSRNATPDRSWDTLLILDGELIDRQKSFAVNHPLADFVQALPERTIRPLTDDRRAKINQVQDELRRTRFSLPDGFDDFSFLPLGIPGYQQWPFEGRVDRLLVMSPFLSEDFLEWVQDIGQNNVLISRLESLAALPPERLAPFGAVYFLNPDVRDEEDAGEEAARDLDIPLEGLHAKLYIVESGWDAAIWTGSANATGAAFERNVEFMVKLTGKKSAWGINTLLRQEKGTTSFIDLLCEFKPGQDQPVIDLEQRQLESQLDALREGLIKAKLRARVTAIDDASGYQLEVYCPSDQHLPDLPNNIVVCCWPITLRDSAALTVKMQARSLAVFERVSFDALSAFFAFELSISASGRTASLRFVLNLPLDGAPVDRYDQLLRSLLGNSHQVVRFLHFLLADDDPALLDLLDPLGRPDGGSGGAGASILSSALFEMLLHALHRQPDRLDQVQRLVTDLKQTAEGQALLPAEFDAIWGPIWQVRQELKR